MTSAMSALCPDSPSETNRPVCLWNPEDFDPREFLCERLHRRADLARFVIHKIIWANVFRKDDKAGFVPLKAQYLRKFFPDSKVYRDVMRSLNDNGAIISDGRYVRGEKCLGYKLGEAFAASRHRRLTIADATLAAKVARHKDEFPKTLSGVNRHLYDHLASIEIDLDGALDMIQERGFDPINQTSAEFIADKYYRLATCAYGRVHTNITNLNKELRQFLRVRGESLVNLDIANSQPLIFASILKSKYEFNPEQTSEPVPDDVLRYVELCQCGRFYDHLMEQWGIPAETRSSFKVDFFARVFYGKNRPVKQEAEMFGDLFPNVYAQVLLAKADDYKALSRSLQRAESDIIIGGVASRCMAEMPHVFIGTIHDSVLTTPTYADAIKAIVAEEFLKVGLEPTIREERA